MELSTFLCTCKHAVNVHESVYFNQINCLARFEIFQRPVTKKYII